MNNENLCTWQPLDEFVPKGLFLASVWCRNRKRAVTMKLIKQCGKFYDGKTQERLDLVNLTITHYMPYTNQAPLPKPIPDKPKPTQKKPTPKHSTAYLPEFNPYSSNYIL